MMIPDKIYSGGYATNPLESVASFLEHSEKTARTVSLTQAQLSINGVPLQSDPTDDPDQLVMAKFKNLYEVLGQQGKATCCGLSLKEFNMGYFWAAWDLTKSARAANAATRQPVKPGHLRLELKWDHPLPFAINVFCMAEYHSKISVDKNRNVVYNFLA